LPSTVLSVTGSIVTVVVELFAAKVTVPVGGKYVVAPLCE
jgi:hypothetical protein